MQIRSQNYYKNNRLSPSFTLSNNLKIKLLIDWVSCLVSGDTSASWKTLIIRLIEINGHKLYTWMYSRTQKTFGNRRSVAINFHITYHISIEHIYICSFIDRTFFKSQIVAFLITYVFDRTLKHVCKLKTDEISSRPPKNPMRGCLYFIGIVARIIYTCCIIISIAFSGISFQETQTHTDTLDQ